MRIGHASVGLGLALLIACQGVDETETAVDPPGLPTKEFLALAAQMNLAEMRAGRLAEVKGAHFEVQGFGRKLLDDHGAAQERLTALAVERDYELPVVPDEAHRASLARLHQLDGPEFDREFALMMVRDHQTAVALFENQAGNAVDEDVQAFAEEFLPVLREHLERARELLAKVGTPG